MRFWKHMPLFLSCSIFLWSGVGNAGLQFGEAGESGNAGRDGKSGITPASVTVILDNSSKNQKLTLSGTNGAAGTNGTLGKNATSCTQPKGTDYDLEGASGGDGGAAGSGGDGGNGGDVTAFVSQLSDLKKLTVISAGGKGAAAGLPSSGGKGCACSTKEWKQTVCSSMLLASTLDDRGPPRAGPGRGGDRPGPGNGGDRPGPGNDRPGPGHGGDRPGPGNGGDRPGPGHGGDRPGPGNGGDRPGPGNGGGNQPGPGHGGGDDNNHQPGPSNPWPTDPTPSEPDYPDYPDYPSDPVCSEITFDCTDGSNGLMGDAASEGQDGKPGTLKVVFGKPPITEEISDLSVPVTTADGVRSYLFQSYDWEEQKGAKKLLGKGSIVNDTYYVYTGSNQRTVRILWDVARPASDFSDAQIQLHYNGYRVTQKWSEETLDPTWYTIENDDQDRNTLIKITHAIKESEAKDLQVLGLRGEKNLLQLELQNARAAMTPEEVVDQFEMKLEVKNILGIYRDRYKGTLPAKLVRKEGNRILLDLGRLSVKQKYLQKGKKVRIQLKLKRNFKSRHINVTFPVIQQSI